MFINREKYLLNIDRLYKSHKAIALLGPRQCGKTTLAKMYARSKLEQNQVHLFDLENPVDLAKLQNPMIHLEGLSGLIIIDEVQRRPELFPVLRVLLDDDSKKQRYLILGSASRDLIHQSSESLAGRIAYIEVNPFSLNEVHDVNQLFIRGGFPNSYLALDDEQSNDWLENYIRTYLEKDIPALGINIPSATLRRFWLMLAHYNGSIFNASEIGTSMGLSDKTVKNYLDILCGTFMVRQLNPWYVNIGKRQSKRSKIYFRDSGIFHHLLNVHTLSDLHNHPKLGIAWECFALEQIIRINDYSSDNCYFWAVHQQVELDLLVFHKGRTIGYEFKYSDAPRLTQSMQDSFKYLNLDYLYVVYPGQKSYKLAKTIDVIPVMQSE